MDDKDVIKLIESQTDSQLSDLQKAILAGSWEEKRYEEIAKTPTYNLDYVKDVGSKLWQILSNIYGEKVTKRNFKVKSEQYWSTLPTNHQDWGEAPDLPSFFGRNEELTTLKQWILADKCRLVAIVGMAGIGKTQLSVRLGKGGIGKTDLSLQLARGIQDEFDYVIWRRLLNAPSVGNILCELITFLSNHQETTLSDDIDLQISRLLYYLRQYRCLVILDNAETILQGTSNAGHYRLGYEGYGQVFETIAQTSHQSCLLLTSREKPQNICRLAGSHNPVRIWELEGLDSLEGRKIFTTIGEFSGSDEEWLELIEFYNGNALALELAAHHIQEVFSGNISQFLSEGTPVFDDLRDLLNWHFERLSELEQEILYWLAINREPTLLIELKEDLLSREAKERLSDTLQSLQRRLPLEKSEAGFTLQPVLIEYVTERIIEQICQEIFTGKLRLFHQYATLKALAKDYIRETQVRLLLQPIIDRLIDNLGSQSHLEAHFKQILVELNPNSGYAAGNILNLLCHLKTDLKGYNFSGLTIRQAYLQGMNLAEVNFAHSEFVKSLFTQSFGGIHAVAFSPDGNLLAAGDSVGDIRLIRVEDGQQIATFGRHGWWVSSVAFSPDRRTLASASLDHTVKLWDIDNGQCLWTLKEHTSWIWIVIFSPDGQIIVTGSDDTTIKLWDANTGQCFKTLEGHTSWVLGVAFHPKKRILASGSHDRTIKLWDLNTGQCLKTLQGSEDSIWSVSFSPDGQRLVSSGYERVLRLWDTNTGECLKILEGHKKEIKIVSFSPDGTIIASGSFEPTVKLWKAQTGECLKTLQGHLTGIRSLVFSPDSQTLASSDNDQVVKFWDTNTGKCLKTWQGNINWVWSIAISPDGKTIASGHLDHTLRLWDAQTGECLKTLQGHKAWIWAVAFSPDGTMVASGSDDETVRLWDVDTGRCLDVLQFTSVKCQGGTWTVAFSPDGQFLASGGQETTVRLWDVRTGRLIHVLKGHPEWVWSVAFHPNNQIVASGSDDKTIKFWDVATGECIKTLQGHTGKVRSVAFSWDGQYLVSGSEDFTLKFWNTDSGECLNTLEGHQAWVWSVVYSRDGQYFVSGSADHTVKLWQVSTGKCLKTLFGHTDIVRSVAFSPDSQTIISGSQDATIKLWDIQTGQCLKTMRSPRPYEDMNIIGVKGLTEATIAMLKDLGAVELSINNDLHRS